MEAIFVAQDIADIVSGARQKPADPQSAATQPWLKDDAKARFIISSAMEYEQLEPLLCCTTSKEMWTSLATIHEQKSETCKLLLT